MDFQITRDDGGDDKTLTLNASQGAVKSVSFFIDEPNIFSVDQWSSFVNSIRNGRKDDLTFCDSNGTVIIRNSEECVEFESSRYGCGGGGTLRVTLEKDFALLCFEKLLRSSLFEK